MTIDAPTVTCLVLPLRNVTGMTAPGWIATPQFTVRTIHSPLTFENVFIWLAPSGLIAGNDVFARGFAGCKAMLSFFQTWRPPACA
jgi:hypothetical protein